MQSELQEINITHIISAISNKKREGILVFCIVCFVGIVLTFILPRTYQTTEILRLAMIDGNQIETVDALKMLFQSETKFNEIADELGLPLVRVKKSFSVESKAGGVFIAIKGRGTSPEEAIRITKLISTKILEREEQLYKPIQEKFDSEMVTLEKDKKSTEQKIAQLEKTREGLQADIAFYQREIAKRVDAQSEGQGRIAETYIKLLSETKRIRDETANELVNFKQHLFVLEENIKQKKFTYVYLSGPSGIEISALMPEKSFIPPNIVQNIIYSAVLGVFLAIVWVFIRTFHIKHQTM
jgi:capsular polysaccharide biosynthesis protein